MSLLGCEHSPVEIEFDGETVCSKCGIVLEDKMIDRSGDHTYDLEGYMKNSSHGMKSKVAIHDEGLTCIIGRNNSDFAGTKISNKTRTEFQRLRIQDTRSKLSQKDRSLIRAFSALSKTSSSLGIPSGVSEDAAALCKKALSKDLARGRSVIEVLGACLYLACRRTEFPKTLDNVAHAMGIQKKALSRTFRKLVFELDIQMEVPLPEKYLPYICNSLDIDEKIRRYALKILTEIQKSNDYTGAKPNLICAAAVYFAALSKFNVRINQNKLSKIANTSTISIRKYVNEGRFESVVKNIDQ